MPEEDVMTVEDEGFWWVTRCAKHGYESRWISEDRARRWKEYHEEKDHGTARQKKGDDAHDG